MNPYFSYPYFYDRNSTMMPQAPMMAPQETQPLMMPQETQPMMPVMPNYQAMPAQSAPYMPMQQQQPVCPYMMGMMHPMANMNAGEPMDFEMPEMQEIPGRPDDPPPVLSNNPAIPTILLFKELTGYPNYGNPSKNADILYTGNRGTWTFAVPASFPGIGNLRAQLMIRAVLDDHVNTPVSRYSARIAINGNVVHNGPVPLAHGVPSGGQFTNWETLTFPVSNVRRNNTVVIVNTSNTDPNDWIGLDWMELRMFTR